MTDQPLGATHPHLKKFVEFLAEFNNETARGCVLTASSFLDDLLGRTIAAFLIDAEESARLLEGFNARLGTFAAKIVAAFSLGLISHQEFRECELIRKIRNGFAHQVQVSFDQQWAKTLCSQLTMAAKPYGNVTVDTRGQFTTAAVCLILNLTNRPHYVSLKRRTYEPWPY